MKEINKSIGLQPKILHSFRFCVPHPHPSQYLILFLFKVDASGVVESDSTSSMVSPSQMSNPAHVVQAPDDRRVHASVFHQIPHRMISCDRQAVLLPVETIQQIEEGLGLEVRGFSLST